MRKVRFPIRSRIVLLAAGELKDKRIAEDPRVVPRIATVCCANSFEASKEPNSADKLEANAGTYQYPTNNRSCGPKTRKASLSSGSHPAQVGFLRR
jgi:hypothetical protein